MKLGKLAVCALVAFLIMFFTDWLWFGMLMKDSRTHWPGDRPEPLMMYLVLGVLIYAIAFAHMFGKYHSGGTPVNEGASYGFWVVLLAWLPMGIVWYALMDTQPLQEYLTNSGYRLVQQIIMGIAVAFLSGMGGHRGKGLDGGGG